MQGQLFTQDFLFHGSRETPPYQELSAQAFAAFGSHLHDIYVDLNAASTLNEAQTEQLVIERVLVQLGWGSDYLPQVNLSASGARTFPTSCSSPTVRPT